MLSGLVGTLHSDPMPSHPLRYPLSKERWCQQIGGGGLGTAGLHNFATFRNFPQFPAIYGNSLHFFFPPMLLGYPSCMPVGAFGFPARMTII